MVQNRNKKFKKVSSNNTHIMSIVLVVTLLIVGVFAFNSGSSGADERDDVASLTDNTATPDNDIGGYTEREEETIGTNEQFLANSQYDKGNYNVTYDDDDIVFTNINTSEVFNMSETDFEKLIGELDSNQFVEKVWFNNDYDVEGFTHAFQAFLIRDDNWNNYKIIWSIDDNDFVLPKLKKVALTDFHATTGQFSNYFDAIQPRYNVNFNHIYMSGDVDSMENNAISISSLVFTDDNNGVLYLLKELSEVSHYNQCHFITSNEFWIMMEGNHVSSNLYQYFSVAEYQDYSQPNIAIDSSTRTTGFNQITLANQDMLQPDNTMQDKQIKILSKEKYEELLNVGFGNEILTEFGKTNVNELLSELEDNPISVWTDTINHNAYGLGTANSEDYDNVDALVIDGFLYNFEENTLFREIGTYQFDSETSYGVQINDDGKITLKGTELIGESFGKFSMNNANTTIDIRGTLYPIINDDHQTWENIWSGIVNLFDYSFDYSAWITGEIENGKLGLVDVYNECGALGCEYGYSSSFMNAGLKIITLQDELPDSEMLEYNGKNYYAFWTLNAQGKDGCLIFDSKAGNLGIRIPVSMCDRQITGVNSFAQVKMLSREESLN